MYNGSDYSQIAIGNEALYNAHINNFDTCIIAIGKRAAYNGGGSNEIYIGNEAGMYQFPGTTSNIAIGNKALHRSSDPLYHIGHSGNIAIGEHALYDWDNISDRSVAIGSYALDHGGYGSIAIGDSALYFGGNRNIAIGKEALKLCSPEDAYSNIAIGRKALLLATGKHNIAIGENALSSISNIGNYYGAGSFNTAIGTDVMQQAYHNAQYNVGIGTYSLASLNNSFENVCVGAFSGAHIYNNQQNTLIGYYADCANYTILNSIAIGHLAIVNAANSAIIGNPTTLSIGGYRGWSNLSDARFKKNIQKNVPGLDFVLKLIPVTYQLDVHKLDEFLGVSEKMKKSHMEDAVVAKEKMTFSGFLAQDVEKLAQKLGYKFDAIHHPESDIDHYSIVYDEFIPTLTKAIQEQQAIIESQNKKIEELLKRIEKLENK